MPRRSESLTETRYPLVLRVYRELGAVFICLLETQWENESPIHGFFFGDLPLTTDGGGTDTTWNRWKNPHKHKGNTIYGKTPKEIFKAIDWACSKKNELLTPDEGKQFARFFNLLIDWKAVERDVLDDIADSISKLMTFALDVAGLEVAENLQYIDTITGESFAFEQHKIGSKEKWILTRYKEEDDLAGIGTRTEQQLALRDATLRLLIACDELLDEILDDRDLNEISCRTDPYTILRENRDDDDDKQDSKNDQTLSFHQYKSLRAMLMSEAEQLFERVFTHFQDSPEDTWLKNDAEKIATDLGKLLKAKRREAQRKQEQLKREKQRVSS